MSFADQGMGTSMPLAAPNPAAQRTARAPSGAPHGYRRAKRAFDLSVCVVLLPVLAFVALALLILNPFFNRGPLFFVQKRMGQGCRPFRAWKFRSMSAKRRTDRGAFDPIEVDRITPLGRLLRRARLDELPQVVNLLRGDMSLIGPRPDYHRHARVYLDTVGGYRERHAVLPGISGYAQVAVGYADGLDGVRAKVAADLYYVRQAPFRFDLWVAWRTVLVVLGCRGS